MTTEPKAHPAHDHAASRGALGVLVALTLSHGINDTLQSVIPAIYPLLKSAFAQRIGVSALRVDGLIASLQRILNVEGYAVLSVDSSQTIRMNLQLLREQFGLGDNNGR